MDPAGAAGATGVEVTAGVAGVAGAGATEQIQQVLQVLQMYRQCRLGLPALYFSLHQLLAAAPQWNNIWLRCAVVRQKVSPADL